MNERVERGTSKNHSFHLLWASHLSPVGGMRVTCLVGSDGGIGRVSFYLACKDNKVEGNGKDID